MKNSTKFILGFFLSALNVSVFAFGPYGELSTCGNYYITSNAGWSNSEYYQIIDIVPSTLTDASYPKVTSTDGSKNATDTDYKTGYFLSPVLTTTDGTVYTPTSVMWPIKYKNAAFAPTFTTSAHSKVTLYGSATSGTGTTAACTLNDNSIKTSAIYGVPGYIDLSRLAAATDAPTVSRHGIIQIDSIPQCERIQWSYSSTSWKRGVKADINYNDGNGWQPLRWAASDYNAYETTFSEQGYQFEEMINKQEDLTSYVSFRIRIWDGDSIHMKVNANDLSEQTSPYTATMTPLAQKQVVRVHQIKIYSGVIPTVAPIPPALTGLKNVNINNIKVHYANNSIVLSEEANVELYSVTGQQLYKGFTNKIDAGKLNKGVYIIKTTDTEGKPGNNKIKI